MEMEKRKVSDSIVETVHMVRPQHLNASDRLFGGALMQWIDEVAGMVAKRHTRRNVITASVDSLSFLRGAYVKDTVVIIGKVTYVGNTSMEVKVDTYVEALSGERTPINHAYFTMVALDKNDRPVRVPRLELETEEEKEEWDKGEKRRELRMMRKEEGLSSPSSIFVMYDSSYVCGPSAPSGQSAPALWRGVPLSGCRG